MVTDHMKLLPIRLCLKVTSIPVISAQYLIEVVVSTGSFDDPGKFGYTAKRSELSRDYEKDLDVLGSQGGPECVFSKQFL